MSRDWLLYLDDLIASAEKIGRLVARRDAASLRARPLDRSIIRDVATRHMPDLLQHALRLRQRHDQTG